MDMQSLLQKVAETVGMQESIWGRFDPTTTTDPIARKIDWNPIKAGGSSFVSRKLVQKETPIVAFKSTFMEVLFGFVFILGAVPFLIFAFPIPGIKVEGGTMPWWFSMFGLIFVAAGVYVLKSALQVIRFDKTTGEFKKGSTTCKLQDVHALQLLSERVSRDKGAYYSYELNLVLKDGTRINVIDHGKRSQFLADTEKLAHFLQVPVWDLS